MKNYILEYYQQIRDGTVEVGPWIRLVYAKLVRDLDEGAYKYSPKKANTAIRWIETHCYHVEGKKATKPLKLEVWQKAQIAAVFGLVDPGGLRHYREIFDVMGRKNGKTLLAAAICRYIWVTEGFGTRVYNVAPKLEQADLIYNSIWTMTQLDPEWIEKEARRQERDVHKRKVNAEDPTQERHRQTDLVIPATNSTVKKIAFAAKRSDGYNPSMVVCDEIAAWPAQQGLAQYEVMASAFGARDEPILWSITTAGEVDEGIYDELMSRSTRFLLGESKETRLLPFIYQIEDVNKWDDINELRKANPNLGVSIKVEYMLDEIEKARLSSSKKTEFLKKYCNIKQNSTQAWLDSQTIEDSYGDVFRLEDFAECYAVVGIDLSQTTDLSAVTVLIERDEQIYTFCQFFLPQELIKEASARDSLPYDKYIARGLLTPSGGHFIDYKDVFQYVTDLVRQYRIYPLRIGYDRYSAQYLIQDLKNSGFVCDDVYQGTNLSPIISDVEGLLKDRKIRIGQNDLMKVHMLNSALKFDAERGRRKLVKVAQNAKTHIDGMAALLDAMTMRSKYHEEIGEQLKNRRR